MDTVPAAAMPPRHTFVFVCQAGELELKSLLLAASLREQLQADHELIAAVPTPAERWGDIAAATRALLERLRVRIVPIVNPIDPEYPIGNKLACIDVGAGTDKIVFLDSDILCLRELGDPACLRVPFAAKPADLRTFAAATEAWQPLYAAAGVALPRLRLPTTVSGEFGLAYFNSGVVCVDARLGFGATWIECARAVHAELLARGQRHWLDQVALPIAVHKRGLRYAALDENFNFPAHLKPLPGTLPVFCHYHWPRVIAAEPVLRGRVSALASEHGAIADLLRGHAEWRGVLDAACEPPRIRSNPPRAAAPDERHAASTLIVTGMPGCGAVAIGAALAQAGLRVIDAAAPRAAAALTEHPVPWELATMLRDAPGTGERANAHAPAVLAGEVAVLCRLPALRRVLPDARIVLCVRDPFETIARWKSIARDEFESALSAAEKLAERWLPAADAERLRAILGVEDEAERRAACWWWFAQRLLEHAAVARVLRSATFDSPAAMLRTLLRADAASAADEPVQPATCGLDDSDRQAVDAICLQAAAELGFGASCASTKSAV